MNFSTSCLLSQAEVCSIKLQCYISFTHVVVLFKNALFCQERPITEHGCQLLVMRRNTSVIKVHKVCTSYMSQTLNTANVNKKKF